MATATKQSQRRKKKEPSSMGWVMSLSSAALMLYCAYVTIIEPNYFSNTDSSSNEESQSSIASSTSSKQVKINELVEDTRPLFQQRYFRDSATWKLPNTWTVKEDINLAKYRFANHWSTLRPNVYFGMKSQPLGLSESVQGGLATGLLWMKTASNFLVGGDQLKVRHDTANDEMSRLEWVRHDGGHYGVQRLRDPTVVGGDLYTSFISIDHGAGSSKSEKGIEWMQMLQTLSYDAPAPTTTSFRLEDAKEWEKKAYQEVRPVTTMFYLGVDCAEEDQPTRLQECHEQLKLRDLKWSQPALPHFQLMGRTLSEGYFTLDIVLESCIEKVTSFDFKAAVSEELDLLHGTKQLLKELREPHSFNTNTRRSQQQSIANNNRVFIDDFGDWQGMDISMEAVDSLFAAFKFTLPPGQRLIFHYRSSPTSSPKPVSLAEIVDSWTEKSYASYQSFEERFRHLMRDSKKLSEDIDSVMNDTEMNAIVTNVFGEETNNDIEKSEDEDEKVLFQANDVEAIKIALSSLLGGMGTFMGQATISPEIVDTVEAHRSHAALNMTPGRMTLTTATPSRTVFPRGFLWDEGFHQLVIASWAPKLTLQTLADWLHAMYLAPHHSLMLAKTTSEKHAESLAEEKEEYLGWIPREMILGVDARQRVPAEFIPQRVDIANPPTFFLVLKRLIGDTLRRQDNNNNNSEEILSVFELNGFFLDIYPRLHAWVQWFLFTQAGDTYGTFRWRGRSLHDNKYIPNTLSSGLDDYPRAIVPDITEKHVDLHAWMIFACETMEDIYSFVSSMQHTQTQEKEEEKTEEKWSKMQKLHTRGQYAAYGHYLRSTLQAHHWSTAIDQLSLSYTVHTHENAPKDANPTSNPEQQSISIHLPLTGGYFDVGLTNETARFVLDVLCRCVNHNQKSAANILDMYVPMSTLHEFFHIQQIRQQLQQQYQQVQKKNKNAEPPLLPPLPEVCPSSHAQFLGPLPGDGVHGLKTRERLDATQLAYGFVPRVGYVALFPLLLQTIDPSDSEKLTQTLYFMEKPAKSKSNKGDDKDASKSQDEVRELFLWTDYGLRSMGAVDVYYQRRNAPGDAPYWRGPIWININYLALSALHHYAHHPDTAPEVQAQCHRLYQQLRNAVLTTVLRNFHETGFFWEQYDDHSGQGIRGHPFTGWTATVVNIFTENY